MALRPGHCYRELERPYTRVATRVMRKNYIGTNKPTKIRKFQSGTPGDYSYEVSLVSKDALQIRDNAMEAARLAALRYLEKKLPNQFFMVIRKYPHHILRENKQLGGFAGADRLQKGMKKAFGKPIGRAIQLWKPGETLISVYVNEEGISHAREALRRAAMKLPCRVRYEVKRV